MTPPALRATSPAKLGRDDFWEERYGHIHGEAQRGQQAPPACGRSLARRGGRAGHRGGAGEDAAGRLLHRAGVLRLRAGGSVRPQLDLRRQGRAGGRARGLPGDGGRRRAGAGGARRGRHDPGAERHLPASRRDHSLPGEGQGHPLPAALLDLRFRRPAGRRAAHGRRRGGAAAAPGGAAADAPAGAVAWLHLRQPRPAGAGAGAQPRQARAAVAGLRGDRAEGPAAGDERHAAAVELEGPGREFHRRLPSGIRAYRHARLCPQRHGRRRRALHRDGAGRQRHRAQRADAPGRTAA